MDCPHCGIAFHDRWMNTTLANSKSGDTVWSASSTICPVCKNVIIKLSQIRPVPPGQVPTTLTELLAYPCSSFRKPVPPEVPKHIKTDYEESCAVLNSSEKASAALARRCLQAILHDKSYTQRDLAKQIDALLNEADSEKAIPTGLRMTIDAIRNFGNFSAHPVTDQTSLQVIDVDPGEAEWCLEIFEDMFDHFYVRPAQARLRKDALDKKLAAAGKPASR